MKANLRDIRRLARTRLHEAMKVAAVYINDRTSTKVLISVRDHTKFRSNTIEGGVRSGNGQMVSRQDIAPSLIFLRSELAAARLTLVKGGVISVERNEAYRLDNAEAPDDITVKWYVTQITDTALLATLALPTDEITEPDKDGGGDLNPESDLNEQ